MYAYMRCLSPQVEFLFTGCAAIFPSSELDVAAIAAQPQGGRNVVVVLCVIVMFI